MTTVRLDHLSRASSLPSRADSSGRRFAINVYSCIPKLADIRLVSSVDATAAGMTAAKTHSDFPVIHFFGCLKGRLAAKLAESVTAPLPAGTSRRVWGKVSFPGKATAVVGIAAGRQDDVPASVKHAISTVLAKLRSGSCKNGPT